MDDILKQKITDKLRTYLNREPLENEIINGQTDAILMHWIAKDDAAQQSELISAVAQAANVDVQSLQIAPNSVV